MKAGILFRRSRLSVIVVAACVASISAVALLAQQPPPPPWFDREPSGPPLETRHYQPDREPQARLSNVTPPPAGAANYPPPQLPRRLPDAQPWQPGGMLGGPDPYQPFVTQPTMRPPQPQVAPVVIFEPGQIIAWVGDQPIQVGDVMPMVEQTLAPYLAKMKPEDIEKGRAEIEQQKRQLMKRALESAIEVKLLYSDFLRAVPADKKDEILPRITIRVEEQFYEKQLPEAMEKAEVESPAALDAKLRAYGSSLQQQKRTFVERVLGQSGLGEKIDYEPEITHKAMLDWYWENISEYEFPAKARWEKLTVKSANFPTREQAWAALGDMGNEVLRGAPLAAVAKRSSQGIDAGDSGYHDWTSKDSLASDVLNQAIFSLPVNQLSERMEDDQRYHIVRVIQRQGAGRKPFLEAQVEIKGKLKKQRIRQQITEYVAKLKKEIHVWTVFDDETENSGS